MENPKLNRQIGESIKKLAKAATETGSSEDAALLAKAAKDLADAAAISANVELEPEIDKED